MGQLRYLGWDVAVALSLGLLVSSVVLLRARRISARLALAEQSVRDYAQSLLAVAEVARALPSEGDVRAAICAAAQLLSDSSVAMLFEPDGFGSLVATASCGISGPPPPLRLGRDASGTAVAYVSGQPFFVPELIGHPAVSQSYVAATGTRSGLYQPVLRDGVTVGVLMVAWCEPVATLSDLRAGIIGLLAVEAATAIDRCDLLARLRQQARTDPLTGLANRRTWDADLERELQRNRRTQAPLALAVLDLDHFKDYNDRHGHQAGDRLLKAASAAWRQQLREGDLLARWGGDEFCVAFVDCPPAVVADLLVRLRSVVPDGQSCSVGVAHWDGREASESLLSRADSALFDDKRRRASGPVAHT